MVMVVLGMSLITAPEVGAAAQAGDLIKMDGLSSVYYLGKDGKRYVFPSESVYFSWYSDFSGVVTISAAELQSYPLGGNITMRPGTKLVKITTDPKVYAVSPNGTLHWIQSEADAIALYGANWASMVVDVADSYFTNYTIGDPLPSGTYPAGTILKNVDGSSIYYWDGAEFRKFANEAAFVANGFNFDYVVSTTDMTWSPLGDDITGAEDQFMVDGDVDTTQPSMGGSGLTVALNAATPVSQNIPGNVEVEFLRFNLTASADGAVNVSSIDLTAYGLSDATNIKDITFFADGARVGTSRNMGSDRVRTFNFPTPISVAAGTTKTVSVNATIDALTGTYGLGIAGAAHVNAGNATVSGSFPIIGNLMSAVESNVGTITVENSNSGGETANFGDSDVLLAEFDLRVQNEDALISVLRLYNGGNNVPGIVNNLKLLFDGEEVSSSEYVDRYVEFHVNNHEVEKGDTVMVEVRGDIGVTTVGNEIDLYFRNKSDIVAIGKTHGFNLIVDKTDLNSRSDAYTVKLAAGDFTINMDRSTSGTPAKDVKPGDNRVNLATLELKSNSEDVTLRELKLKVNLSGGATTTNNLENFELVNLATGGIYDLEINSAGTHVETDEEIFLTMGQTYRFNVRADIHDNASEGTTIQIILDDVGNNMEIEGDVSGIIFAEGNITPSSVSGSIITIREASLDLAVTKLNDINVVGGSNDVIVYQAKLKAGTADDIRLQSIKLTAGGDTSTAFNNNDVSQLRLYLDGSLLRTVSNAISSSAITFSSLTGNRVISAGDEVNLVVKANFASNITEAGKFDLRAATSTDLVARSVNGNDLIEDGNLTVNNDPSRNVTTKDMGDLMVEMLTAATNVNRDAYVLAGETSDRYIGQIRFTTENEDIRVDKLVLENTATSTSSDIERVELVDSSGNVIAHTSLNSSDNAVFDPFNIVFDADKSTSLFIRPVAKAMNVSGDPTSTANDGNTLSFKIHTVEATGVDSGRTVDMTGNSSPSSMGEFDNTSTSKTAIVVGSRLTAVVNDMNDATLVSGSNRTLGKYKLTFNSGDNRTPSNEELKAILNEVKITFDLDDKTSLTGIKLHIEGDDGRKVASSSSTGDLDVATSTSGTVTWNADDLADATNGLADGAKVDGEIVIVITGNVAGAEDNSYVQTSIANLGNNGDFRFWSGGDFESDFIVGGAQFGLLLPYSSVTGGTLSR